MLYVVLNPGRHKHSKLEKINIFGLLYTIKGSNAGLKPVLLTSHQDVVPVAEESTWTYPPFDGHFDGEWLWGRGAFDDKNSLTAIMSAAEQLLSYPDWRPARTILLAFGFDEECSGWQGAAHISERLVQRYGKDGLAIIHDEGGAGIEKLSNVLYALPAVYEKGSVNIWFELDVMGGHSSTPPPHTGIGIMSQVINKLERNPFKPMIIEDYPTHRHLRCIARYTPDAIPGLAELIRQGDLNGLAELVVEAGPGWHYLITTSQAIDVVRGGQKINSIPEVTKLGVNYRLAPQDSLLQVQHNAVKWAREVGSLFGIKVRAFEGDKSYRGFIAGVEPQFVTEPDYNTDNNGTLTLTLEGRSDTTPITPTNGAMWDIFAGTIRHTFAFEEGTVVPVGEAMTGNTDTRHYLSMLHQDTQGYSVVLTIVDLTRNIYRWSPVRTGDYRGIHTVDERILMKSHLETVRFYYNVIRNFGTDGTRL